MANYYASARTNYFTVKDPVAFRQWAAKYKLEVVSNNKQQLALLPSGHTDDGTFPSYDPKEDQDIDFAVELSTHLVDGDVAIIIEVGAEKLRYLHGHAEAINSKGKRVFVNLDEIYERAKKLGKNITQTTY